MKFKLTTILILLLCLCFSTVAQVLTPDIEGMYSDKVYSPSLEGNLLGDPAERNLIIYLPPSYQTSTKRYPVVYLLHGYGDNERQFISQTDPVWQKYKEMGLGDPPDFPKNGFGPMMDELIAQGKIDEMIIVTPNADNAFGGSWYNNSVLIGKYEDYITKDLVNYIDSKYRTIPDRNSRAVAGQSMGGYGAIKLAMRYPDVFGSVASSAGVLYLDLFKTTIPGIIAENPDGMTGPSPDKFLTSATYSMSAAFAPNLNKPPFYVDLSFEYPSPEVIQSVWDKYLENDPVTMVPTHVGNIASLNFLYIDAGDIDEYGANYQTQAYHEALNAFGINHVYRTFAGGHRNKMFESLGIYLAYISDVFEQSRNIAARKLAYTDLWNKGNLDIVDQIYSNDFAGSMAGYSGKDEVKMSVAETLKAYPDLQFTIDDIFASGDFVVTRITAIGTQTGEFMGVPPNNAKGEITGISIARFENGLIKEVWENNDELATAEHLGVIPQMRKAYVWGDPSQVKGDPGTPEANKALATRDADEFWNQKKINESDEIYSPDFIAHNPNTPGSPTPYSVYKQVASVYLTAFPDLHVTTLDMIASGDKVAARWSTTGTHKSELMGIPATGRKIKWSGITIYRIADGKIVEQWWAYDMLGIIKQLTAPVDIEANKAVVKRIDDIYNKKDLSIIDEIYAPDTVDMFSGAKGIAETKDRFAMILSAFPEFNEEIIDMVAEGNIVTTRAIISATHKGTYMGIPATGKKGTMTSMGVYEVINGKITKSWRYNDELGFLQQVGVFPSGGKTDFSWGIDKTKGTGKEDPTVMKNLILRLYNEVWNQGKMEVVDEIYAPNFQTSLVAGGKEGFKKYVAGLKAGFPDINFKVDSQFTEGDMVVSQWTVTGTQTGAFMGIPATGKKATIVGMSFNRIENGLIAQAWNSMDMLSLMVQIGVIPAPKTPAGYDNVFFTSLTKGLNMISLPLKPVKAFTARSLANEIGATAVIKYDETQNRFVGFSSSAPDNGFDIEGGKGYIVNVSESRTVAFTGAAWTNEPPVLMAPPVQTDSAWAFIVNGSAYDDKAISDRYTIIIKNLSTGIMTNENVDASGYFSTAWADLNRKAVVKSGDRIEVALTDSSGKLASGPFVYKISQNEIDNAILNVQMKIGKIIPKATALLQNFPNPFNPETWIPFQLKNASDVTISIYSSTGHLVRTLELGRKDPGVYASQINAAHWDGKNDLGETVSSGIYFYNIKAGDFSATKKMIVKK